ncbi:MAG: membrane protein insertase YidC [Gammaproteobacteria bacterium]
MDVIKTSLIIAIAITSYYLLMQWPQDSNVQLSENGEDLLYSTINESEYLQTNPESLKDNTPGLSVMSSPDEAVIKEPVGVIFRVENEDLVLEIDSLNGRIFRSMFKGIKDELGSENPLVLLGAENISSYFASSGFFDEVKNSYIYPNFSEMSSASNRDGSITYTMLGENNGLFLSKEITLGASGYEIKVEDKINSSNSSAGTSVVPYAVIETELPVAKDLGFFDPERFTYHGPVFSTKNEKYEKYGFDDLLDRSYAETSRGGWVAIIQHYFLTAWVPEQLNENKLQGRFTQSNKRYSVGYTGERTYLSSGGSVLSKNTLYVGPKLPEQLSKIQEDLSLTVDYGFLWWLGKPMYWLLSFGNSMFNNWGFAIIFLTLVIKLLTWPLSAKAYTSMGKLRELQPKMALLQEKHGDNKQAMSQELMEMYKTEGVNPLGGCLPMLLQMPFFLAFYWVLLETVELRHSPLFWIDDLSDMDPYFILPILNAAGMYLSQKMTPTPPNADPMQAQMMKVFPLVFAFMFAWFPSGLVLYWTMNMAVQILQQWWYSKRATSP